MDFKKVQNLFYFFSSHKFFQSVIKKVILYQNCNIYLQLVLWHDWLLYIGYLPGGGVGGIGTVFGLDLPNVVSAVELTPNSTMNTPNSIVKLPHCVNRFNGCIFKTQQIYSLPKILYEKYIFLRTVILEYI